MRVNKKIEHTTIILIICCSMIFLAQSGITLYLASFPSITRLLHTSSRLVGLSLTAYMFGYAAPMLFWGSLSDALGRKPVLIISTVLFIVSSILIALGRFIGPIILLRLIQGIGASGCAIIARATIRDTFDGPSLAIALSYISITFSASLGIFQFLGGQVEKYFNWRIDFWIMAVLGLVFLMSLLFYLPDNQSQHSAAKIKFNWKETFQTYLFILKDNVFLKCTVGGGLGYAIIIAFNIIGPFLLQKKLHLTPAEFGGIGLFISIAYLLGAFIVNFFAKTISVQKLIQFGYWTVIVGGLIGFALDGFVFNIYSVMIPTLIAIAGQAVIYPCSMSLALTPHKKQAGISTALFGFIQQMLCSLVGVIAACLPHNSQIVLFAIIFVIAVISYSLLRGLVSTSGVK